MTVGDIYSLTRFCHGGEEHNVSMGKWPNKRAKDKERKTETNSGQWSFTYQLDDDDCIKQ